LRNINKIGRIRRNDFIHSHGKNVNGNPTFDRGSDGEEKGIIGCISFFKLDGILFDRENVFDQLLSHGHSDGAKTKR